MGKRGLIAYDDKRVLLANLANGQPNPNTHAYGHFSLREEVQVDDAEEMPAAGNDLQIETREQHNKARLQRRHALAVKRARRTAPQDSSDDDEAELYGDDLAIAERAAAARPEAPGRLNMAIDQLIARMNIPRPVSPPLRMPHSPSLPRAGKDIYS